MLTSADLRKNSNFVNQLNFMNSRYKLFRVILPVVCLCQLLCVLLAACASMGRPEGGPRDSIPPVPLYSNPGNGAINFKGKRLRIYFDENVQIQDAMSKVVVSPVQVTPPAVSANGKYVQVEFRDTMLENTTYTVDFSDAIKDLNEGNVLEGYATDFSTGPVIDTLRISGMVFQASNLEPAQGMLVGVYSNLSDTALTTLPFERITKTNQYGQFTIRNLKPGTYRIFAINDLNRDYHWDRSEDIAFYDSLITPTVTHVQVADTLSAHDGSDSVVVRTVTAYHPDDILLTWFNLDYRTQYLAKNERPDRRKISLVMGAPSDTFPEMRIVGAGDLDGLLSDHWAIRTSSVTRDTIDYWITDTMVSGLDSLRVSLTYLRTDSTDGLSLTTDTLRLFMRGVNTRAAEAKAAAKEAEKRRKAMEKGDTLPLPEPPSLKITAAGKGTQDVHLPYYLSFDKPVVEIDSSQITLQIKSDTLWVSAGRPRLKIANPLNPTSLTVEYAWEPGAQYKLTIDSAAIHDVYGYVNKKTEQSISVHKLEDYSSIRFNVTPVLPDSLGQIVVELLNKSDVPVASRPVENGSVLFEYLMPSVYYARAYIDRNNNGKYDVGSVTDSIQPEEVAYYSRKLNLKKNWDIEQSWNIYELPLDIQKPIDVKKNKPAVKKGERLRDEYDEDEDEDGFGTDYFERDMNRNRNRNNSGRGYSPGSSSNYNR